MLIKGTKLAHHSEERRKKKKAGEKKAESEFFGCTNEKP